METQSSTLMKSRNLSVLTVYLLALKSCGHKADGTTWAHGRELKDLRMFPLILKIRRKYGLCLGLQMIMIGMLSVGIYHLIGMEKSKALFYLIGISGTITTKRMLNI